MNDRLWPMGIAAGLLLVVLVNVGFIWIALDTAPLVESSYSGTQER